MVHPFLLAAFPTLYHASQNLETVDPSDALLPLGLSLLVAALGFATLRLARIGGPTAGVVASTALVLFFSFSHGVHLVERLGLGGDRPTREVAVLVADVLILSASVALLRRWPASARVANDAFNASSVALVAMAASGLIEWGPGRPATITPTAVAVARSTPARPRPDVYLVVLDAYGRSDVLKERYGFDNSGFLDRLGRKGFVVARSARSNYGQTALSLASALNLRYLDELAGDSTDDRRPLRRLIVDNPTFRAFREAGYRLVSFASGFDATETVEADLRLAPPGNLRSFHALVADQTPLWLLLGQREARDAHRLHRERSLKVFDELPASSHRSDRPTLTFAHVVAPHPPFVFRADGGDASGVEPSYTLADSEGWCRLPGHDGPADYARRYRDQAAYVTDRIERAVDRILATSKTPPIIVLIGDHGPGSRFDSAADLPNDVDERFAILDACYMPEGGRWRIGPGITPINTVRAVLDEALGTNLGPIADRSFYSSYPRPYRFVEVTDELND